MELVVDAHEDNIPQKRLQDRDSDDSQDNGSKKKRAGRKLITTEASTKRTAQNRAAQRAFRDRKQQYLKDLEDQVRALTEQRERTERENEKLKSCVDKLKQENSSLKGGNFTYENSPVDFDKAMADLFDAPSSAPNMDLKLTYELQQAAVHGTDLTKPGAVSTIRPSQASSSRSANSASPQSVPSLYPNFDLSSATSAALTSSLANQQNSAFSSLMTPGGGGGGLLGSSGSQLSMTDGLSSDILNGIQLLASNQNISTGSFLDNLFDTSSSSSANKAQISPPLVSSDRRSSTLESSGYGTNELGTSRSPSVSTSAATPSDMYVPLNTLPSGSSSAAGALFGLDTLKAQQPTDFAQLAAMLQQSQSSALNSSHQQSLAATPAFNELFSLSPSSVMNDGLISMVSSGNQQGGMAATNAIIANGSSAASLAAGLGTSAMASIPLFTQQQQQQQQQAVDASTYRVPKWPVFPSNLMAYRNPDPLSLAEDSDQLEKLLLDSMYSVSSNTMNATSAATVQQPVPASDVVPSATSAISNASSSSSNKDAAADAAVDQQPMQQGNEMLECTCRNCDDSPCDPCPKHGSPADMSEELRGIAPEMLSYVCTSTNTLANEELDDLCSLMYKHAKCTEVQMRVQQVREKLKTESNLEMINTKKKLAKQRYSLRVRTPVVKKEEPAFVTPTQRKRATTVSSSGVKKATPRSSRKSEIPVTPRSARGGRGRGRGASRRGTAGARQSGRARRESSVMEADENTSDEEVDAAAMSSEDEDYDSAMEGRSSERQSVPRMGRTVSLHGMSMPGLHVPAGTPTRRGPGRPRKGEELRSPPRGGASVPTTPAKRSWEIRRIPMHLTKHDAFRTEYLEEAVRIMQQVPVSGTANDDRYEMMKMCDALKLCGYELGVVDPTTEPFFDVYRMLAWSVHSSGPNGGPAHPPPPISDEAKSILLRVFASIGRRIREETKDMAGYHRRHVLRKLMLADCAEPLGRSPSVDTAAAAAAEEGEPMSPKENAMH
ncbi:DNA-binding transcription factor yap1, partial [Coemansia sp. RSA 1933]